ncbi:hypothetical protein B0H14DRAFT_3478181 [Mycena olivaceomarginata]|nr:hypothetical protein B0H14DRAFT_3478181 [Mycena olivaceomarginata]
MPGQPGNDDPDAVTEPSLAQSTEAWRLRATTLAYILLEQVILRVWLHRAPTDYIHLYYLVHAVCNSFVLIAMSFSTSYDFQINGETPHNNVGDRNIERQLPLAITSDQEHLARVPDHSTPGGMPITNNRSNISHIPALPGDSSCLQGAMLVS